MRAVSSRLAAFGQAVRRRREELGFSQEKLESGRNWTGPQWNRAGGEESYAAGDLAVVRSLRDLVIEVVPRGGAEVVRPRVSVIRVLREINEDRHRRRTWPRRSPAHPTGRSSPLDRRCTLATTAQPTSKAPCCGRPIAYSSSRFPGTTQCTLPGSASPSGENGTRPALRAQTTPAFLSLMAMAA